MIKKYTHLVFEDRYILTESPENMLLGINHLVYDILSDDANIIRNIEKIFMASKTILYIRNCNVKKIWLNSVENLWLENCKIESIFSKSEYSLFCVEDTHVENVGFNDNVPKLTNNANPYMEIYSI